MGSRRLAIALSAVLLASLVSVVTTATPPRPGTEGNGLTENESATLWSRDDDSRSISDTAYREAFDESRTPIQAVANRTDLTFTRPPATASVWSRHDHGDYRAGNMTTSVYPTNANLSDSRFLRDAHATVFAVTPSTKAHRTPKETTWYVAPEGRLLGTVDYRVRTPSGIDTDNRTVSWTVESHAISEVRLTSNGTVVGKTAGSHRPTLRYELAGGQKILQLEATVEVSLEKTVRDAYYVNATGPNGTNRTEKRWRTSKRTVNDSLTVSDRLDVDVYDLSATLYETTYPDNTSGVAVFQNGPWQGYSFDPNRSTSIRGVWRFYTARETAWDSLTRTTSDGSSRVESDALPVYVHAYPSELGPRTDPVRGDVEITTVWGTTHRAPESSLGENVNVEVVSNSYEASYGIATEHRGSITDGVTVHGIVRGVRTTVEASQSEHRRQVRETHLSLDVQSQNESGATLLVELTDVETGAPVRLTRTQDPRYAPLLDDPRSGYVTVGARRVETNASGQATVRVDDPGVYTARYHPGSWLSHDPAYLSTTASARWHPLTTIEGCVSLLVTIIQWFLPFGIAWYAGRHVGKLFDWEVR